MLLRIVPRPLVQPRTISSSLTSSPSSSSSSLITTTLIPIPIHIHPSRPFTMSDKIQRNPHPDFKSVEASRPAFDTSSSFRYTKTPSPAWQFGSGANDTSSTDKAHVSIDPYEPGRPGAFNYKLLISAITPRPIAFVSTRSADGKTTNLAPFSYFNFVNHDPPMLVVGFASALANAKDTLRNLLETNECVVNIISEHFVEAANATSVNAPYGTSEWDVSGLTPAYDCKEVKCARVKEAVFSVECKLDMTKEWESRATPGKKTGTMAVLEGLRFWVREDALNEEKNIVDPAVLRPISRLGGITYARTVEAFELTRPDYAKDVGGDEGFDKLKSNGAAN